MMERFCGRGEAEGDLEVFGPSPAARDIQSLQGVPDAGFKRWRNVRDS